MKSPSKVQDEPLETIFSGVLCRWVAESVVSHPTGNTRVPLGWHGLTSHEMCRSISERCWVLWSNVSSILVIIHPYQWLFMALLHSQWRFLDVCRFTVNCPCCSWVPLTHIRFHLLDDGCDCFHVDIKCSWCKDVKYFSLERWMWMLGEVALTCR